MSFPKSASALVNYLAPRETEAGAGACKRLGGALRAQGVPAGTVLVVLDRFVAQAGLARPLFESLADAGFDVVSFDEIEGEPNDATVSRGAALAREKDAAAVVGVGGGSALDTAKLVALLVRNEGSVGDWLGRVHPPHGVAPLALVPTTVGTGSEATQIAMVTVAGAKQIVACRQFLPAVAVLDPDLVAGLPAAVVASTGMDALAHALESMLSTDRNPFTLTLAREAASMILLDIESAVLQGEASAKGRLLYAAHLAGLALNAGVVLGHSLAYVVARHAPMSHGDSCAMALPYCLAYNADASADVVSLVVETVMGSRSYTIEEAATALRDLSQRLGQATSLSAIGIESTEVAIMAGEVVRDYPRPNNPVPLEQNAIMRLLSSMHTGSLADVWTKDIEVKR